MSAEVDLNDNGRPHIPLGPPYHKPTRVGPEFEDVEVSARCSCGFWGPATQGEDPRAALARVHAVTEPSGCARCSAPPPAWRDAKPLWHRYHVTQIDGVWSYVCADGYECAQRQLAAAWVPPAADNPLVYDRDVYPTSVTVSLDDSYEHIEGRGTMRDALTLLGLAEDHAPRPWGPITDDPHDRRAILAMVTAHAALEQHANRGIWRWSLAARQAGASWEQLCGATGFNPGEMQRELRSRLGDLVDVDNDPAATVLDGLGAHDRVALRG